MSIAISSQAIEILESFGWSRDRSVDVSDVEAFIQNRGFVVTTLGREFLRSFHGLKFVLPPRQGLSFVNFDVPEELGWLTNEDLPYLDRLAGDRLCPIGHGGGNLLFLSQRDEMLLLSDQWLGFSKLSNLYDGMDLILGVRRLPEFDGTPLKGEQIPPEFRVD